MHREPAAALRAEQPTVIVHYAQGPPFRSMMDLDESGRRKVLAMGSVSWPDRYADPSYVATRMRIESAMLLQFEAAGGSALRPHPHYGLMGRSAKSERTSSPGRRAYVLQLSRLPPAHTSFTWGDSFRFDPEYRRLTGTAHPASGAVYQLHELHDVMERWASSVARPAWQELEFQLWFDPAPDDYTVVDFSVVPPPHE